MRYIRDNLDLAQLQADRQGFILNARSDRKKLHSAGCEAVGAMVSTAYPKLFFQESEEDVRELLDAQWGRSGWTNCGLCFGIGQRPQADA